MMSNTLRRALIGTAVAAMIAAFSAPAVMAAPAPASNPMCGSVAGLMHNSLAAFTGGAGGRNLVSIPRVSPINGSPNNQTNNGFHKLCDRMGLTATGDPGTMASIDGDGLPDNAELTQFDGKNGLVSTYTCDQIVASAPWDPGAAVEIKPDLSVGTSVSLIIPGVQCSQRYAVYETGGGKGTQLWAMPLSTTCGERNCVCAQLNLPTGAELRTIWASMGQVEDFVCGVGQIDSYTRGGTTPVLASGEGMRIITNGATPGAAPGDPVNCLSGTPCPATPSNDYPAALIY